MFRLKSTNNSGNKSIRSFVYKQLIDIKGIRKERKTMKNKCKNMMLGLMAFATVLGATPATGVFAADPASFNNSTASTVSGTNSETFTAGSDASQGQVGKETDQVLGGATASAPTETKSQSVSVYATKSSSVQIKVPQVLIGNATKSAYHVGVKGDITTKQTVTVTPAATFELKDVKDADRAAVTATVKQNKTSWSCTDLATAGSGNYVYAKGDISYAELHAGSYSGVFNLAVNLNYAK